jgi:hypothetical protein
MTAFLFGTRCGAPFERHPSGGEGVLHHAEWKDKSDWKLRAAEQENVNDASQ